MNKLVSKKWATRLLRVAFQPAKQGEANMVKIGCDLSLSGKGLPSCIIRSKSYSHAHTPTHIKFFHALHDLCIPLALYALVSNLSVNKQKMGPC